MTRRFCLALIAIAGVAACKTTTAPSPNSLSLTITAPPGDSAFNPFGDAAARFAVLVAEGDLLNDSEYYTISPYGPEYSGTKITLPSVPFGPRRQMRVEVWNGNDEGPTFPFARGRSLPVDIKVSSGKTTMNPYVTRIDTFTPPFDDEGAAATTSSHIGGSATLLANSQVVLGGGATPKSGASKIWDPTSFQAFSKVIEGYDPDSRKVVPLGAELTKGRAFHASAAGGKGEVIFTGGLVIDGGAAKATNHVDVFYPDRGVVEESAGTGGNPHLGVPRARHTCTLIFDGSSSFLCAGGEGEGAGSWEIWDTDQGSIGGDLLKTARWNHAAARVPALDGVYVILVGGENTTGTVANFEVLYFRTDYQWENAAEVPLPPVKVGALGRTLPGVVYDGQSFLYVIGGYSDKDKTQPLTRIDVYDLASDESDNDKKWRFTSENASSFKLASARGAPMVAAAKLTYGPPRILVAGGIGTNGKATDTAELIYGDVVDGTTLMKVDAVKGAKNGTLGAKLDKPRAAGVAVPLLTGHVLVVGGGNVNGSSIDASTAALLYNPR